MRGWLVSAALLLSAASAAAAGIPQLMGVGAPPGINASYTGPGDIVSGASAWYGLRAYSAAVAATGTQKAVNIRRASDNATSNIVILTTGALDVATATTFCTATTCFVTKWYDQSGNTNDAAQATAGNQPQLLLGSTIGTRPALFFNASHWLLSGSLVVAVPYSVSVVAERTGVFTTAQKIVSVGGNQYAVEFSATANNAVIAPSIVNVAATDSIAHALQSVFGSGTNASVLNVDGTEATSTITAQTTASLGIGANFSGNAGNPITGYIGEAGFWPAGFTAGNRSGLRLNQKSYWGTP